VDWSLLVLSTKEALIFLNVIWFVQWKTDHMVEGSIIDLFNFKGALVRDSVKVVVVDFERDGGADIRSVKLIEQYWSFAFGYPKVFME